MKNILIISGHPDLQQSVANKTIIETLEQTLPQAEVRRLDTLYPDYRFDIAAEQAALLKADIIVWQFPFSWYSIPGVMKLWLDKVFLHGFAHAHKANSVAKNCCSPSLPAPRKVFTKKAASSAIPLKNTCRPLKPLRRYAISTTSRRFTPPASAIPTAPMKRPSTHKKNLPPHTPKN
jgi:NAD(P)H dehydrogenase (quinone)